ncbi:HVA22-like protein k [Camellia lanceoleosa]|uniref:HVA22-like protein k n=1 Tax=Camellia lanceoleosa TaxID=1840588 RepID=A0ACC0HTA5_9ERIC|nr:HVA22-like protein k [Camellia lanceoleosa]
MLRIFPVRKRSYVEPVSKILGIVLNSKSKTRLFFSLLVANRSQLLFLSQMALLGSIMPSEVGLRLLLCPLGSNIVVRTACCSVGVVLPVYSTFKAIETKNQNEQQRWLIYWAAFGSFSIAEVFTDKIISWFPLYYHMKFAFLVWLQLPSTDGAKHLYMNHLRPFLSRHQARLDQILGCLYGEMAKLTSAHQAEIQFAKTLVMKILVSANQMASDIFHPVQRQANSAIEGPTTQVQRQVNDVVEDPTTQVQNSESDNDE